MRCWVKSRNERNPHPQLPADYAGHSEETAGDKPEEGGDDVKSSWPLRAGLHTCYNGGDSGQQKRELELIPKSRLSSDCSLQLESMKLESLVIADQHAAVNTFPGLVHQRQTHPCLLYTSPSPRDRQKSRMPSSA